MNNSLQRTVEKIYAQFHNPSYLRYDPLEFVYAVEGRQNREIAGLLCSSLAYGRIEQIKKSIAAVYEKTGRELYQFASGVPFKEKIRLFSSFSHRFNRGIDIAVLLQCCAVAIENEGSIEALFVKGLGEKDATIKNALAEFSRRMLEISRVVHGRTAASFRFFFPSPGRGSSCKRLNMFLRWMVRPNDGIDLGIWENVPASKLVMPVDTHVARISRKLGITRRRSADWEMAEQITAALRRIAPDDPVRYDFSLCRSGMIDFRSERKKG
jgi:uncharacterized protein (TIGR02757 family)